MNKKKKTDVFFQYMKWLKICTAYCYYDFSVSKNPGKTITVQPLLLEQHC